ncbi:MAG: Abi family protein [Clostridia bacterium]|nr:Abi family protein [Clostridia bacterium]
MSLKEHQPPLDVDAQIENLKNLGLVIGDEDSAKSFLNDVSYFRFIKAYSLGWKPKNSNYQEGTTFDMLKELYLFNSNFRQLLFPLIERVEVNLRCRMANYFCVKYGVLGYLDAANFANKQYHDEFLDDIDIEAERNAKAPFVKNFRQNYVDGTMPLYALVELFSFGTLSKFYKNMKNEDKKAVAKTYGVGYTYFESWIESIAFVRNICAHYGRLYNVNLSKSPMLYKQYQGISNLRIYAILLCLKNLLPNDLHWIQFVDTLELLIEKYPSVQIQLMGFPENWKELLMDGIKQ